MKSRVEQIFIEAKQHNAKLRSILIFNAEDAELNDIAFSVINFDDVYVFSTNYVSLNKIKLSFRTHLNSNLHIIYSQELSSIMDLNAVLMCNNKNEMLLDNIIKSNVSLLYIFSYNDLHNDLFTKVKDCIYRRKENTLSLDDSKSSIISFLNVIPNRYEYIAFKKQKLGKIAIALRSYDEDIVKALKKDYINCEVFVFSSDNPKAYDDAKVVNALPGIDDEKIKECVSLLSDAEHIIVYDGSEICL